jgi:myo-inositol 2-dehydrogenase/D-chiro-inositol 1-dehydrogenase
VIRVGVIGLGRMGMLHLINCSKIKGVKVVAAADSSKKALDKAKSLHVDRLHINYRDLLNHPSGLDAVILSLPNFMHFESIESALEAGLNVFAEKPLAPSVQECRKIVGLVEKSGRKFMVGHSMRFVEALETMKEKLDEGQIGDLEVATMEEIINGPFEHFRVPAPVADWWFDPKKSGGGALLDIGYHMIDLFRFFAGDAEVLFSYLNYRLSLPVEDGAILILRSASSAKGIVNVGWYQKTVFPKYNFRAILNGTAGHLSSEDMVPHNLYLHAVKEGSKNILRRILGRNIRYLYYTYYYESFYKELEHFFGCIKNDSNPLVSAQDGLKTVEIIQTAYDRFQQRTIA